MSLSSSEALQASPWHVSSRRRVEDSTPGPLLAPWGLGPEQGETPGVLGVARTLRPMAGKFPSNGISHHLLPC